VYGLSRLHDLFVSFMSGNTTSLGVAMGRGDTSRAVTAAVIVALFVLGVALGTILAESSGRWQSVLVMGAVTVMLAAAAALPWAAIQIVVVAMGALNAAMSRIGVTGISLTYVTGALVKFGQGLGRLLCGRGAADWSWTLQGALWLCLLFGAVAGVCAEGWFGAAEVWLLPAVALVLTISAVGLAVR
jgi:uncharacterized membrane protein YoaK (UPF0700 family)